MHIIKTLSDIREKQMSQSISKSLGKHLAKKMATLRLALEPETDLEAFSLAIHGPFGVLEKGDKNLSAIGLPESLTEIMPEWVSRLEVADEVYYVLYIMALEDHVVQVYLPDGIVEKTMRLWLNEQPVEEEAGCDYDNI